MSSFSSSSSVSSISHLSQSTSTSTAWAASTSAKATSCRLTASAVHQRSKWWRMLSGGRVSMIMPSPVPARSRQSSLSSLYADTCMAMIPPLTSLGISRHRSVLHVGLCIWSSRRPEQALPGNPSRHCRPVLWTPSVSQPLLILPAPLTKIVHTLELTSSVLLRTAAGSSVNSDTDGRSSPVSASTV